MFASTRTNDAKSHRQKRSRLIKEMAADLNRNEDSIASSTGSAHGTVSTDPTFTESIRQEESMHEIRPSPSITPPPIDLDESDSFGFHPGRDGAINSTGQWDISYTDMKRLARDQQFKEKKAREKAKIPELRATAKKYGRWSPKPAQGTYVIDVSAIDKAFPDFSGGIDSEDDLSRDLGRSHNRRPAKHISINVPVYCDTTDHSDSRQVTNTGAQVTNTTQRSQLDTVASLPLQNLSLNDLNIRPNYAESEVSGHPSTKSFNVKTSRSTNVKHGLATADTHEIDHSQVPFDHFNMKQRNVSRSGNKENIMPKSSIAKQALRTSSNPRFQARVRDELDSSRITSVSLDDAPGTQDISQDMSIVSGHSASAPISSLRAAVNAQMASRLSVGLHQQAREASSAEHKNNKRKQPAEPEVPAKNGRNPSNASGGTVPHKTSALQRENTNARAKVQSHTFQQDDSLVPTINTQNGHLASKQTSTFMSFVAPSRSPNLHHSSNAAGHGLPSVKNGMVRQGGTPGKTNTSFVPLGGFELPEEEEDIYQMCESQQVRIGLLEEERNMQAERIRMFEQEMAAMKQQLAEFEAASRQKWVDHKCSDPKLQDQFNTLQATVAQVKHENGKLVQEKEELRRAKRDYESHKCIDTELEMENAQLAADNERLEGLLHEWDGHQCKDGGQENENLQLKAKLEKYQGHVCRDRKLEREVRYLKEMKGAGSDLHLHITLKDARCRKRKE